MVESLGGTFLHHDGGVENSAAELHGKLAGAGMVLCPVDRLSHDACLAVKKACEARMKPFRMLRGSGLTSLARSLESLAASCANVVEPLKRASRAAGCRRSGCRGRPLP
jgi:hypothetical protein